MKRIMSPAFFAVVVICFFLPFVSISCQTAGFQEGLEGLTEEPLPGTEGIPGLPDEGFEVTVSGWEIVTGADVQPTGLEGLEDVGGLGAQATPDEEFPGRIWAIAAFGIAILGIGLSFLRRRLGGAAAIAAGALGAIFLFLLRNAVTGELGPAGLVGFDVSFEYGYWLALVSFVLAALGGVWVLLEAQRAAVPPPGEPPPPPGEGSEPGAPPPPE